MREGNPRFLATKCVLLHLGVAATSSGFFLCMGLNIPAPRPKDGNRSLAVKAQTQSIALKAANKTATTGFRPSLEMKENVDFLLTPALLVQEAIREDVVITYPSE